MWPHFINLLHRSWYSFLSGQGTTNLGFISVYTVPIYSAITAGLLILAVRGKSAMIQHWKQSLGIVFGAAVFGNVLWFGPIFAWNIITTVYTDHEALVSMVPRIETAQRCWISNYAVPAVSSPQPWGMATILCNTTITPPYSVELNYDQGVTVGPFTFPVGSEFAKSVEYNEGTKVVTMFDLHTIIPNEPFSMMAKGSGNKFPLVKAAIIRAKGLALEFHP
jgi:hypothetical protein